MRIYLPILFFLPVLLTLTACQSVPTDTDTVPETNSGLSVFPIATAVQVDYQDEVKLLRINQLIAEQKALPAKQRAVLFYERGLIYDRMGLSAHSRYDFYQAIHIDPTFAEAYNSLGLYQLLAQSYSEAFENFDSAIELSKNMQYSYLHRAVGLYQVHRYQLANEDIDKFYAFDVNDPYRILWRFIIKSKTEPKKAKKALQEAVQLGKDKRYAWLLVDVIAGRTTENAFFKRVSFGVKSNKELAQRLCEAYFYLAEWHKLSGDLETAVYYFKLSTATNVHDFIEYKYSLMELNSIQSMFQSELKK